MNRIKRPVAATVLFTFLAMVLQPLSVLAQDRPQSAASRRAAESGEERFSRTLNEIHEILKEVAPHAAMPHMFPRKPGEMQLRAIGPNMKIEGEAAKPVPRVDVAAKVSQLRAKAKELASLEEHVRAGFDDTARHIKEKSLPAEILARHEEALKAYEARAAEFKVLMGAVERASGAQLQSALGDLAAFMAKYPNQKTHTPTDPNNLPWGSPKPVTREPYTRPSQFRTSGLFGEPVRVAQAGSLSGISLPSTTLPATPVPADTAPTEDVQITQPIRDLAASLNNNPVQIYNWVRNNIQFVPSYGSIQGSDMTLQTKGGNAFDTASLLIALLRAANVPARYVYGTVEIPADKVMNWVGGAASPQAAMNLMGQGGIPAMGIAQSGQVRWIRFEHVWVEAFVDYVPSRGAVNRNPNTWVPLDASFKQYHFTPGPDLAAAAPLDAQGLVMQIQQGAVVNSAEGSVSNVNYALAQQALAAYQAEGAAQLSAQYPNATLADLLGRKAILEENRPILLGTLPYARIATGARLQALPDNLRWKFRYSVYASDFERALEQPAITHTASTASLAGKRIVLSARPSTPADAATINSFLPAERPDGSPFPPSELPRTLPGYLVRVTPVLQVEGQVVGAGSAVTLGSEIVQNSSLFDPMRGWIPASDNRPTVGEVYATFVKTGAISDATFARAREAIQTMRSLIESEDESRVVKPVRELLHAMLISYFRRSDETAAVIAQLTRVAAVPLPSFGATFVGAQTLYSFGVPRLVRGAGYFIDIDSLSYSAVGSQPSSGSAFGEMLGKLVSGLEHAIPEKFLSTESKSREGVSAVKLLSEANRLGQKIFRIDSSNVNIALSQLSIAPEIKSEILNSVAVGKYAVVHQHNVTISRWTGAGYIIVDPETGAGAYKISGGTNGGGVSGDEEFWGEALADMIFDMLEKFGKGLLKFIGAAMGYISKLIDIVQIFTECSGLDLYIAILAYVWLTLLSILIGLIIGILIANVVGAIIGILVGVIMMAYITDAILARCRMR